MNDRELREAYAAVFRKRPDSRSACPSAERLRALVERGGPESERLETLDHVMRCAACRPEFNLMQAVTSTRPRAVRSYALPLAVAATLALAVSAGLLWRSFRGDSATDPIRGSSGAVELLAPRGDASGSPTRFVWRAAADPAVYVLELFTPAGDRLFTVEGGDTAVTLPDSVSLARGERYHWWVVVRWPDGRERRTLPATFSP